MIVYNMRERGPLEYDKFILNTFQYVNMINYYINQTQSDDFNKMAEEFNSIYQSIIDLSDKYYLTYKVKET